MAKSIDPSTRTPIVTATEFLTTDDAAHSWFEIKMDTFGPMMFNWKWYEPTGSIHREYTIFELVEKDKIYRFWDTLLIKGTLAAVRQGTWRIEVFTRTDKLFEETFSMIRPTYKVAISVSGFASKFFAAIYVDGAGKGGIAGGSSIQFTFDIGTSHTLSVDQIVPGDEGTRYRCPANSRTVSSESSYTFAYETEHYLRVLSTYGVPRGEGWYRAGSTATFSVDSRVTGPIGVQYVFERWSGSSTSTSPQASIVMDGPKLVSAMWGEERIDVFYLIIGIVGVGIVAAVFAVLVMRRRQMEEVPAPKITPTETMPPLDEKVYNYIVEHRGEISLSQAAKDLGISMDELKQTTKRLMNQGKLA